MTLDAPTAARLDRIEDKLDALGEALGELQRLEAAAAERRRLVDERLQELREGQAAAAAIAAELRGQVGELTRAAAGRRWSTADYVGVSGLVGALLTGLGGLVAALTGHPPPALLAPPASPPAPVEAPAPPSEVAP